jgi:hypothetical protein
LPMSQNVFRVIGFQVSIMGLVESNQDGHVLTDRQGTSPLALLQPADEEVTVPMEKNALLKLSTSQKISSKLSMRVS